MLTVLAVLSGCASPSQEAALSEVEVPERCRAVVAAAALAPPEEDDMATLLVTGDACTTADEWATAIRAQPAAIGHPAGEPFDATAGLEVFCLRRRWPVRQLAMRSLQRRRHRERLPACGAPASDARGGFDD